MRDGAPFFIFIRHQAIGKNGQQLADDGSLFPGNLKKKKEDLHNSSAFDLRSQVKVDPAMASSSEEDSEVDYNDDAEEIDKEYMHVFTVNLVLRYPDESDEVVLHWGLSRKAQGAWGTPD